MTIEPLNDFNDNLYDQLLNMKSMTSSRPLNDSNDSLNDQLLNCMTSYNDH